MKKTILFIILIAPLYLAALTQQVEVKADNFEADENKQLSYFNGNVSIIKGEDEIKSQKLEIKFNKKNRPISYTATKDVSFKINTDTQHFVGTAYTITYSPTSKLYTIQGNVQIKETTKNRVLKGEKIVINRQSGKSKITGSKNKPVKFTFTVEE